MKTIQRAVPASPIGGSVITLSPSGSPYTYQNTSKQAQLVVISGGTVSTIAVSRDGVTFDLLGILAGQVVLSPGDYVKITYVLIPSLVKVYPL